MTDYFVGPGGNNSNAGTSWALRKLTIGGAEAIGLAAGDTVYVAPGTPPASDEGVYIKFPAQFELRADAEYLESLADLLDAFSVGIREAIKTIPD